MAFTVTLTCAYVFEFACLPFAVLRKATYAELKGVMPLYMKPTAQVTVKLKSLSDNVFLRCHHYAAINFVNIADHFKMFVCVEYDILYRYSVVFRLVHILSSLAETGGEKVNGRQFWVVYRCCCCMLTDSDFYLSLKMVAKREENHVLLTCKHCMPKCGVMTELPFHTMFCVSGLIPNTMCVVNTLIWGLYL